MISAKPVWTLEKEREAEFYLFLVVLHPTGAGRGVEPEKTPEKSRFQVRKWCFLGVLEGNRYFCVMCCVPISGYLFAGTENRSAWLRVSSRFFKLFAAILCHARR